MHVVDRLVLHLIADRVVDMLLVSAVVVVAVVGLVVGVVSPPLSLSVVVMSLAAGKPASIEVFAQHVVLKSCEHENPDFQTYVAMVPKTLAITNTVASCSFSFSLIPSRKTTLACRAHVFNAFKIVCKVLVLNKSVVLKKLCIFDMQIL